MNIKWRVADLYRFEMLLKYFNSTDERKIITKLKNCSIFDSNFIFNIYNNVTNFTRYTNVTFEESKNITLSEVQEYSDKMVKLINKDIIDYIINYCNNNNIEYEITDNILTINNCIISQQDHLFRNIWEIEQILRKCQIKINL